MRWINLGVLVFAAAFAQAADDPGRLARAAFQVLEHSCKRCHGPSSPGLGGVRDILSLRSLTESKLVVPGSLSSSRLWARISERTMPPGGGLEAAAIQTIRQWILAGAPNWSSELTPLDPGSKAADLFPQLYQLMEQDLLSLPESQRRNQRYLSLHAIAFAAEEPKHKISFYADAARKLVNSLSWQPKVAPLITVGSDGWLLRLDLKSLGWNPEFWDQLAKQSPYSVRIEGAAAASVQAQTETQFPWVRADWLASAATSGDLYYRILGFPETENALEKLLGVDTQSNILSRRVLRGAFLNSGVSLNNRLIERHELSGRRYYWKSYDFRDRNGRSNLFASPVGPGDRANEFRHDGSEIIFSLPNGLQAYALADGKGKLISTAPIELVQDNRYRDPRILNARSCMSCHDHGMKENEDRLARHVAENPGLFEPRVRSEVAETYGANKIQQLSLAAAFRQDREYFEAALEKTAAGSSGLQGIEPIQALISQFEQPLNSSQVLVELGLDEKTLAAISASDSRLAGAVSLSKLGLRRDQFESLFQNVLTRVGTSQGFSFRAPGPSVGERFLVRVAAHEPADEYHITEFLTDGGPDIVEKMAWAEVIEILGPDRFRVRQRNQTRVVSLLSLVSSVPSLGGITAGKEVLRFKNGVASKVWVERVYTDGTVFVKERGSPRTYSTATLHPAVSEFREFRVGSRIRLSADEKQTGQIVGLYGGGMAEVRLEPSGTLRVLQAQEYRPE